MLSDSNAPLCRQAASRLTTLAAEAEDPELTHICVQGLLEIADRYAKYKNTTVTGRRFMDELDESVRSLLKEKDFAAEEMHSVAFQMIEAIAVVIREASLRESTQQPRAAQEAVMRYFEESGHWHPGDGSLVSDYYYNRVPIGVMHSLINVLYVKPSSYPVL